MKLFLNLNDNKITIAILRSNKTLAYQKIQAKTEKLLLTIDKIFNKHKIRIQKLQSIRVDKLDGTFSQVRAIIALVNTLSFALQTSIFYNGKKYKILYPQYTHEPTITRTSQAA